MTDTPTTTDAPTTNTCHRRGREEPDPTDMPNKTPSSDGTGLDRPKQQRGGHERANAAAAKKLAVLRITNKSETEKLTDRAITSAEKAAHEWQKTKYQTLVAQGGHHAGPPPRLASTDTETVYLYLRDSVEVDENGTPQGLDKAIKELTIRSRTCSATPAGARDNISTPAGLPRTQLRRTQPDALACRRRIPNPHPPPAFPPT